MYLEVKDLKKSYGEGGGYVQVLKGITAGVEKGEMCVIQGTSGSGKLYRRLRHRRFRIHCRRRNGSGRSWEQNTVRLPEK